jgi:hypothetical protein
MIRRLGIGCVLVAALALPAGAAAKNSPGEVKNAAKQCKSLRSEMGRDAFREEFGTNKNGRNAFGKCVALKLRAKRAERRVALENAVDECKAELVADPAAFMEKYGRDSTAETSGEEPGVEPAPKPGDAGEPGERPELGKFVAFGRCVLSKVKSSRSS